MAISLGIQTPLLCCCISKKAKLPVQGALKELLANEGVDTTRISLSDLFKYMKGEVGIEGTKNALERHHIKGVGVRATGDYQLLKSFYL